MKVVMVDNWPDLAKYSKFPYEDTAHMRTRCRACGRLNTPLCSMIQKYGEWDCQYCDHKNPELYLFPDAANTFFTPLWVYTFYRN